MPFSLASTPAEEQRAAGCQAAPTPAIILPPSTPSRRLRRFSANSGEAAATSGRLTEDAAVAPRNHIAYIYYTAIICSSMYCMWDWSWLLK
mmetsp:Transcript_58198/g.138585  ORF Transcript_58198/g.138585 Transcript_58198/m.138585 type:complete len:91 (-) Transcript_58198:39-311(-)